ncbi:MAG: glutamate-5-semialdehyde dehydrogenase [Clostridiaceae bacterium]
MEEILNILKRTKYASSILSGESKDNKNLALRSIADLLVKEKDKILSANILDIENGRKNNMKDSLIDRLYLDSSRIKSMAGSVLSIAEDNDPIGNVEKSFYSKAGLLISKVTIPIGTIGIIYEARPNVTVDAAALCIKSSNSVILKGGKEALNSNLALVNIIREAIGKYIPEDCINYISTSDREALSFILSQRDYLDLIIPRGGAGLIKFVAGNSKVPVIETGVGNCHIYVDESADLNMAENIIINAKTQRPGVCNAMETLLVHKNIADKFLPSLGKKLSDKNVEIRGCEKTVSILKYAKLADEEDYYKEFLDLILAVKVVDSIEDAIAHIQKYTTNHSEAIITNDYKNSKLFISSINSSAVYVNASTRFTDGGEFGFGAEIGISTQKLHARGPMGLKELTSYKYVILGNGEIR